MTSWNIYLASWVIQDGNYPDFKKGQYAEFALEFWPETDLFFVGPGELKATLIEDCKYKVTAKVVFISRKYWIIDFGLLAYAYRPPPRGLKVGSTFTTDIGLGIDYYVYAEFLWKHEDIPPMIYSWNIQKILQQTTSYIKIYPQPAKLYKEWINIRDPAKSGYKEIEATNAWKDDKGNAVYILACEKLDTPGKRASVTTTL